MAKYSNEVGTEESCYVRINTGLFRRGISIISAFDLITLGAGSWTFKGEQDNSMAMPNLVVDDVNISDERDVDVELPIGIITPSKTTSYERDLKSMREIVGKESDILMKEVKTEYTIKEGDTLNGIASNFKTTVEEILRLNLNLTSQSSIVSGQVLKIKSCEERAYEEKEITLLERYIRFLLEESTVSKIAKSDVKDAELYKSVLYGGTPDKDANLKSRFYHLRVKYGCDGETANISSDYSEGLKNLVFDTVKILNYEGRVLAVPTLDEWFDMWNFTGKRKNAD